MSGIIVQTTSAATANALVLRDANSRAKFADPSANDDVDTKGHVMLPSLRALGRPRTVRGLHYR